jgi:uncharacterized protein (UPF0276 family)
VSGIGLRAPHYGEVLRRRPALDFLEVHSENFFAAGGPALALLERFRGAYAISLHGVGLSLGSTDPLDEAHLAKLAALVRRFDPLLVSEHLSWSSAGGRHANELLPLPHTHEALAHLVARIGRVQDALGREILVENVSSYLAFPGAEMTEAQFVAEAARRSGCRVLLDVNNIYVNAANHGDDAHAWLEAVPSALVGEIHVAGHEARGDLLVDTHGARVCDDVWALYARALERCGPCPTLVEWDTGIPSLDVLLDEAATADAIARRALERAA